MKILKIIALTVKGKEGLKNNADDKKKQLNRGSKFAINQALRLMGYKEEVISEDPYTFQISFKHPGAVALFPQIIENLNKQFKLLGLKNKKDYKVVLS